MKKLILFVVAVMLALCGSLASWGADSDSTYTIVENYKAQDESEDIPPVGTSISDALSYAYENSIADLIIKLEVIPDDFWDYTEINEDSDYMANELASVTFVGAGSVSLRLPDDSDIYRHFVLDNKDFTLGLKNLKIVGGNGGGIWVKAGTLSADNVTFSSCNPSNNDETEDRVGGAVHVMGQDGKAVFTGGRFSGNEALKGGALYLEAGSTVTFTGTPVFEGNTSPGDGGAIYSAGTLEFDAAPTSSGGIFRHNNSKGNGGAVYSASTNTSSFTSLTFGGDDFNIDANYASNGGGAVYIANGTVTFTNTYFKNNSADSGGAISIVAGTLDIASGNTITLNRARKGGAVYADAKAEIKSSEALLFDSNSAHGGQGGALWLYDGKTIEGLSGSVSFSNNTADYGGAVYVASDKQNKLILSANTQYSFSNNSAVYDGGAVYAVKADVEITGQDITTGNNAGDSGGFLWGGGKTSINGSTVSNQTAQRGGAVYSENELIVDDSAFSENRAEAEGIKKAGGGAIYISGRLTVRGTSFDQNTSEFNDENNGGGAIFSSGDAVIYGSTFTGNSHTNNGNGNGNGGGAIYFQGSMSMDASDFYSNQIVCSGNSGGGAIYADSNKLLSINDCLFKGNRSATNGGAIRIDGNGDTKIVYSTFRRNQSENSGNGGAIYANGRTLTTENCDFDGNTSQGEGGAIFVYQTGNNNVITAKGSFFRNNTASSGKGGAFYLTTDQAVINRCTFYKNQSLASGSEALGGAVYLNTSTSAVSAPSSIKNSVFYGNTAEEGEKNYGGAVYLTGEDILLIYNTFTGGNGAADRGGAVYAGTGQIKIGGCIMVGNEAKIGGDIYREGTITSRGYSRIGIYGSGGNNASWRAEFTSVTSDRENSEWKTETFFGTDEDGDMAALVANDGFMDAPQIGINSRGSEEQAFLLSIPLHEIDDLSMLDRATNAIPYTRRTYLDTDTLDIWGTDRFKGGNPGTIGAHYLGGEGGGGEETGLYEISSISMSGIPNTLKSIGQTSSLVAVIHYINDRTAYGVPFDREIPDKYKNKMEHVTWSSSMPSFVKVDKSGNITALQMTNNANGAIITVSTVRGTPGGKPAKDSRAVKVTGQYSYMNTVSPAYQNYFSDYVQDIMEHDISVSFTEIDRSTVMATGFQRNFAAAWGGAKPKAVTDLSVSTPTFSTATTYTNSQGLAASNGAGVSITFKDRSNGDVFPLTYSWTLTGRQVKALLGSDMTKQAINDAFAERLFSAMKIDYQTATKSTTVVGSGGVKGSEARRYGALALTKADGNAGLHIELTAYLANVASNGSNDGPQLVRGSGSKRLLVVPDGANDGAITGTMWLAQSASTVVQETPSTGDGNGNTGNGNTGNNNTGGNSNSSGGGGGCASMSLGLIGTALVIFMKRR